MSRTCGEPGPGQKCGHQGRGPHQLHLPHQGHVVRIYLTEAAVQTGEDSGKGIVEHICIWNVSCSELEYVCMLSIYSIDDITKQSTLYDCVGG